MYMVKNEINRMIEFKRLALNRMESDILIDDITNTYRLNDSDEMEEEQYYE